MKQHRDGLDPDHRLRIRQSWRDRAIVLLACALGLALALRFLWIGDASKATAAFIVAGVFMLGVLDAFTREMRISTTSLRVRDRILRVQVLQMHEIRAMTWVPGVIFSIQSDDGRAVRFPAGAPHMPEAARLIRNSVLEHGQLILTGEDPADD